MGRSRWHLIGTSAGAILMTPTIALHALFDGRRPEEIKDATALDLVPFEFFPHAHAKTGYLTELVSYSAEMPGRLPPVPMGMALSSLAARSSASAI